MDFCKYERDFLWFVYFGITTDDANDYDIALQACVYRAYLDMCRTIKNYMFKASDLESKTERRKPEKKKFIDDRNNFIETVFTIIKNAIPLLTSNPDEVTENLFTLYKDVRDEAGKKSNDLFDSQGSLFTYGQAQKWVNMTLKYMLIMGIGDIRKIYDKLHMPLDSIVFEAASKNKNEYINDKYDVYGLGLDIPKTKWSNLTEEEYDNYYTEYINNLENGISAIEWESKAWIAQAKKDKEV